VPPQLAPPPAPAHPLTRRLTRAPAYPLPPPPSGGVVGALAAIGLAAGGAFALRRRSRLQRQGWAKEELAAPAPAGISSLDHALGISRPAQNI
jgi:hypothetical protein